jgi:hypothetical protein
LELKTTLIASVNRLVQLHSLLDLGYPSKENIPPVTNAEVTVIVVDYTPFAN